MAQLRQSQRQPSRLRALAALTLLASVCWLTLAATSRSEESLAGSFIVIDGPQSGVSVHADADGSVEFDPLVAFSSQGHIRTPTARCGQLHFRGRIEDSQTDAAACWRVVRRSRASNLLIELTDALSGEEHARGVNTKEAPASLRSGRRHLERAFDELEKAARAGEISEAKFERLKDDFVEVRGIDERAAGLLRDDRRVEARQKLERAIELKHHIVDSLPMTVFLVKPPNLKPLEADFDSANKQTVYTERATDPDGRNLRYHWTLVEHNDPTCINFEPNQPRENQAIWHHADNQGCNHSLEGPRGHNGTITVVVRDGRFECAAFYNGSQGDNGNPSGTGPDPPPCQPIGG